MTNASQSYIVRSAHGDVIDTNLTAREAAQIILNHDGQDYEIRQNGESYELWYRQQVANKGWTRTVISSYAATEAAAEDEIFAEVLTSSFNWGGPWVATMADYTRELAEND